MVYTDPQAAAVGAIEAPFSVTVPLSEVAKTATYTHAYAESRGFLTLLSDGDRLTGGYALGPEAGEWMQQATLAIHARVPLDVLRDVIQPFPTFSEIFVAGLKALRGEIAAARSRPPVPPPEAKVELSGRKYRFTVGRWRSQHTPRSPLLGRLSEQETLRQLVANVRGGQSAVLVVRGEAGIGKTALLRYLTSQAPGFTVARAVGVESEMELPFAGLHQLCGPMLGRLGSLAQPQRRGLSIAFGLATGDNPDRFLVALAALSLMAETSEERPLLCVVDDAQWLDQASAQVLGFVGRRLLAESVALVFAARTPSGEASLLDHLAGLPGLQLEGLGHEPARALLATVTPGPLDESVRARIIEETRGNPLALLELDRGLGAAELAGGFALPDAGDLPRRIENQYIERLGELPPEARQMTLLAAADPAGDTALVFRAARLLGLDAGAANPAVAAGLLSVGANVRFRHPLVRSAVYRAAAARDRRAAHGALAAATDPGTDPDRRAWHRAHATAGPDETVAGELIGSAGRALRRGGVAAAAAFWERAVVLTPDPGERAARALEAAGAKYAAGDFEATQALLAAAEVGPLSQLNHALVQRMRAQVAFALRRGSDAPPLLLRAAQRLEDLDTGLARQTYLEALVAAVYAGRLAHGQDMLEIACAARSAPPAPEHEPLAHSQLLLRGLAARLADGYPAAAPLLSEALRRYRARPQELDWLVRGLQPGRDGPVGRPGVVRARHRPGPAGPRERHAELASVRARLPRRDPDPGR